MTIKQIETPNESVAEKTDLSQDNKNEQIEDDLVNQDPIKNQEESKHE